MVEFYQPDELALIIQRVVLDLGVDLDEQASHDWPDAVEGPLEWPTACFGA